MHPLYIAAGGFLGAILRYFISLIINQVSFPWATFTTNLLGCYFMGIVIILSYKRWSMNPRFRLFFAVGLLGSFTTFSTFTLETLNLIDSQHFFSSMLYFLSSPILGILSCVLGIKTAWAVLYKYQATAQAEEGQNND